MAALAVAANPHRLGLAIINDDTSIKVYVGGNSTMTASTGHVVKPGSEFRIYRYVGPIYMVAESGEPTVTFAEW